MAREDYQQPQYPDLERMVQQRRLGYLDQQALLRSLNQQRMLQGQQPARSLEEAVAAPPQKVHQTEVPGLQIDPRLFAGRGVSVQSTEAPQDSGYGSALASLGDFGGLRKLFQQQQPAVPMPRPRPAEAGPAAAAPAAPAAVAPAGRGGASSSQTGRPAFYQGTISLDGRTYTYGSGGGKTPSAPYGTFPITPAANGPIVQSLGGFTLNGNRLYDPLLGRDRVGIAIHPQTVDSLRSAGCFAVSREQWPAFKAALLDKMKREGPLQITVHPDGRASIEPVGRQSSIPAPPAGAQPAVRSAAPQSPSAPVGPEVPQPAGVSTPGGSGVSDALVNWVAKKEAFSASAFSDYGQTNIGYGTSARGRTSITEPAARAEMRAELQTHMDAINKINPNLPQGAKDALASLSFNTGGSWYNRGQDRNADGSPTLLGQVRAGNLEGMKERFVRYTKAGGQDLGGLVTRRQQEVRMFDDPRYIGSGQGTTAVQDWGGKATPAQPAAPAQPPAAAPVQPSVSRPGATGPFTPAQPAQPAPVAPAQAAPSAAQPTPPTPAAPAAPAAAAPAPQWRVVKAPNAGFGNLGGHIDANGTVDMMANGRLRSALVGNPNFSKLPPEIQRHIQTESINLNKIAPHRGALGMTDQQMEQYGVRFEQVPGPRSEAPVPDAEGQRLAQLAASPAAQAYAADPEVARVLAREQQVPLPRARPPNLNDLAQAAGIAQVGRSPPGGEPPTTRAARRMPQDYWDRDYVQGLRGINSVADDQRFRDAVERMPLSENIRDRRRSVPVPLPPERPQQAPQQLPEGLGRAAVQATLEPELTPAQRPPEPPPQLSPTPLPVTPPSPPAQAPDLGAPPQPVQTTWEPPQPQPIGMGGMSPIPWEVMQQWGWGGTPAWTPSWNMGGGYNPAPLDFGEGFAGFNFGGE